MKKTIKIEGMSCAHCVKAVTNALNEVDGVQKVKVDLKKKTAVVEINDSVTDSALREVIESEDFEVVSIE